MLVIWLPVIVILPLQRRREPDLDSSVKFGEAWVIHDVTVLFWKTIRSVACALSAV